MFFFQLKLKGKLTVGHQHCELLLRRLFSATAAAVYRERVIKGATLANRPARGRLLISEIEAVYIYVYHEQAEQNLSSSDESNRK